MSLYRSLADAVLVFHFAYVVFIVLGMAAILAGVAWGWPWVRNFWFRAVHLLAIALVIVESACGMLCPLTQWEDRLRELAGEANAPGSFIGRWIDALLFVDVPPRVLLACYCLFGAVVVLAMVFAPPRRPWKK
jgi:hypothetical protein